MSGKREQLKKLLLKPGVLLFGFWVFMLVFYYLQPIRYVIGDWTVWIFIFSGCGIFLMGTKLSTYLTFESHSQAISARHLNAIVFWSSLLSIIGISVMAYDKVILSGLDYSKGLAYIRELRGMQLNSNIDVPRSIWLYIGYPLFSLSYPAMMLLVLKADKIKPWIATLAQLSFVAPFGYGLLYGGRMSFLILLLLMGGCCVIRWIQGKTFFPREHLLLVKLIIVTVCMVIYSNHVLSQRRATYGTVSYSDFLTVTELSWDIEPKLWFENKVDNNDISLVTAMNLITNCMYVTNGIAHLNLIINRAERYQPYYGVYQVGILSPLLRVFDKNNTIVETMDSNLKETSLFGYYITAWGAAYLDFGLIGCVIFIALWGFMSGMSAQAARNPEQLGGQLLLSFFYCSIPMSIFNGPFGMSNSFLVFISLIIVVGMLKLATITSPVFKSELIESCT